MILAVETSTSAFSVALYNDHEIANVELKHELAHSQHIVSVVHFLFQKLSLSVSEIKEVFADIGPGSFTGIRIGLSFVNTLSQLLHIPLLGVSSLDLLAFEDGRWYNSVVPFIRSRRNEVYTAYYQKGIRVTNYLVLKKKEFLRFLNDHKPRYIVAPENDYQDIVLNTGSGLKKKLLFSFPRARTLLSIARECCLKSEYAYLKPIYMRGI